MSRADHLVPGRHYAVATAFSDFDRVAHAVGEVFRFESQSFVPHDDGHLLRFTDPDGHGWSMRLRDTSDEQGSVLAKLDVVLRVASDHAPPTGPLRDADTLLRRARITAAVSAVATGVPHDALGTLIDEHGLRESLTLDEEGWLTGRVEPGADAAWQIERAVVLGWALGLRESFRNASSEDSSALYEALMAGQPNLQSRPRAELREQLAWCAALEEFRAAGLPVYSELAARSLALHSATLAWALGRSLA